MIKNLPPEQVDKNSFLYKVEELLKAFKLRGYEYSGVYTMRVPAKHFISDRRYISDGNIVDSYEIFGLLLLKIPFLIKTVGKYLRTYNDDMMSINTPGLSQPKVVLSNYDDQKIENQGLIYSPVERYQFQHQFPTDIEIEQLNESRKRDYINIICIIWLINLLRSNPPTYKKVGMFRKELVPIKADVISSYLGIRELLVVAYGKESAKIIINVAFELLNIHPHEFLSGVQEP